MYDGALTIARAQRRGGDAGVGVPKTAFAFDLTAACSGFLFATVTASQFLNNGGHKTALVVGADALTRWVDWTDRNTCVLFGDGAGAMVLTSTETDEEGGILGFEMHSDGNGYCNLQLPYQQTDRAVGPEHHVLEGDYEPISMNGKEVYKFATREVPEVIEEALANAGLTTADVDHLLLHQANIRIMEIVAQRLGIPMEKVGMLCGARVGGWPQARVCGPGPVCNHGDQHADERGALVCNRLQVTCRDLPLGRLCHRPATSPDHRAPRARSPLRLLPLPPSLPPPPPAGHSQPGGVRQHIGRLDPARALRGRRLRQDQEGGRDRLCRLRRGTQLGVDGDEVGLRQLCAARLGSGKRRAAVR